MDNKIIKIKDILRVCNGTLISGNEDVEVKLFCSDTRTINYGDMYIAIKGEKTNGNLYVEDAMNKGAVGAIIDDVIDNEILKKFPEKVIIKVENSIEAIQELAKYKRSLYNIPVIAITGSVRQD